MLSAIVAVKEMMALIRDRLIVLMHGFVVVEKTEFMCCSCCLLRIIEFGCVYAVYLVVQYVTLYVYKSSLECGELAITGQALT